MSDARCRGGAEKSRVPFLFDRTALAVPRRQQLTLRLGQLFKTATEGLDPVVDFDRAGFQLAGEHGEHLF